MSKRNITTINASGGYIHLKGSETVTPIGNAMTPAELFQAAQVLFHRDEAFWPKGLRYTDHGWLLEGDDPLGDIPVENRDDTAAALIRDRIVERLGDRFVLTIDGYRVQVHRGDAAGGELVADAYNPDHTSALIEAALKATEPA